MQVIGLDVGFGFTKATNGRETQIFKSVVGDAAEATFNEQLMPSKATLGRHLQINGEMYYVGEMAEQQSRGRGFTLDPTQFLTKYAKTLAISACAPLADGSSPVRLVTGLPGRVTIPLATRRVQVMTAIQPRRTRSSTSISMMTGASEG